MEIQDLAASGEGGRAFLVRFVKKALPTGAVEVESAQTESAAAGVRMLRSGFRRYRLRRAQFSQAQLT